MVIGNELLLQNIDFLIENKNMPSVLLLIGERYQGKKFLLKSIADKLKKPFEILGNSINDLNVMKQQVYTHLSGYIYIIHDLENYNYKALESLLKIFEEPPKNVYFLISCNNEYLIKQTIKNRCFIVHMQRYCSEDLFKYVEYKKYKKENLWYYVNIMYSPTLIDFYNDRLQLYENFVYKFINHIVNVSAGNALKCAENFETEKVSKDSDKIKIDMFFNFLLSVIVKHHDSFKDIIFLLTFLIQDYAGQFTINGIDKNSLIKEFIIAYRRVFLTHGFSKFSIKC